MVFSEVLWKNGIYLIPFIYDNNSIHY